MLGYLFIEQSKAEMRFIRDKFVVDVFVRSAHCIHAIDREQPFVAQRKLA